MQYAPSQIMKARFVVLEGIDGAGTTTLTARLADALAARGIATHRTREPSGGPVGRLLREVLTGRQQLAAGSDVQRAAQLGLLFAADRLEHLGAEVLPRLAAGAWVISDRYDHSSVAYQSITGADALSVAWLRALNQHAARPDLTVVLDVSPDVARERRLSRAGAPELFDDDALQRKLAAFYAKLETHFPDESIAHVDADRGVEEVLHDVLSLVARWVD